MYGSVSYFTFMLLLLKLIDLDLDRYMDNFYEWIFLFLLLMNNEFIVRLELLLLLVEEDELRSWLKRVKELEKL